MRYKLSSILCIAAVSVAAFWVTLTVTNGPQTVLAQYSPAAGPKGATGSTGATGATGIGSLTASVTLTALQVTSMFAAPIQVIAAQGSGNLIVVDRWTTNAVFGSAAFTGGGTIALYYGMVSPPVSLAAIGIPVAFLTTFSANQTVSAGGANGGAGSIVVSSIAVNAPVYVSNISAPFVAGTGASVIVTVWYHVLAGVS